MKSLSSSRTIYQEKVKLNVSRLTFAGNPEAACCGGATPFAGPRLPARGPTTRNGWFEGCEGSNHRNCPAIRATGRSRRTGQAQEPTNGGNAVRPGGACKRRRRTTTLIGNPAVVGRAGNENPATTVRPEALRPHLSMGLPKRPPLLCTGACGGASKVLECCEP